MEIDCNEMIRMDVEYSLERWLGILDRGEVEAAALDHVIERSLGLTIGLNPGPIIDTITYGGVFTFVVDSRKILWHKVLRG